MFLNHYLDIVEAIEEGSLDSLDYTDFVNTDFPQEIPLPASPYLEPADHETVKEWVLAVSMDQNVEQVIHMSYKLMTFFSLIDLFSVGNCQTIHTF